MPLCGFLGMLLWIEMLWNAKPECGSFSEKGRTWSWRSIHPSARSVRSKAKTAVVTWGRRSNFWSLPPLLLAVACLLFFWFAIRAQLRQICVFFLFFFLFFFYKYISADTKIQRYIDTYILLYIFSLASCQGATGRKICRQWIRSGGMGDMGGACVQLQHHQRPSCAPPLPPTPFSWRILWENCWHWTLSAATDASRITFVPFCSDFPHLGPARSGPPLPLSLSLSLGHYFSVSFHLWVFKCNFEIPGNTYTCSSWPPRSLNIFAVG